MNIHEWNKYILVKAHLSVASEIYTPGRSPGGVYLLRPQLRCALSDLYHLTMALTALGQCVPLRRLVQQPPDV